MGPKGLETNRWNGLCRAGYGDPFAIHGFASNGRCNVQYYRFKNFDEPYDIAAAGRSAAALQSTVLLLLPAKGPGRDGQKNRGHGKQYAHLQCDLGYAVAVHHDTAGGVHQVGQGQELRDEPR